MTTVNEPLPNYSLADLFRDINAGRARNFQYNNKLFAASRTGLYWTVTYYGTGIAALVQGYIGSMTDLQGVAACLLYYNCHLVIDKEGNIIQKTKAEA